MSRYMSLSFALASFIALASTSDALAHCFVGARFFPATLATDDPCVADEMSLPTVTRSKTADMPPATEWDISGDFSKRITENFGVTIGQNWTQIRQPDGTLTSGFENLETTFQFQVLKDRSHELAVLTGLIVDWGHTGSTGSGLADTFSQITPTLYFGKGFGDLPELLDSSIRGDRTGRLSNSDELLRFHPERLYSATVGLRGVVAIQHALSEIRSH